MINKVGYGSCITCKACMVVCPKGCISFVDRYRGFEYPKIDKSLCINCGLCEKACPAMSERKTSETIGVYATKAKEQKVLEISSSGGMFYTIAKKFIENGGAVIGAAFDNDFNVKHMAVGSVYDLPKLCGSKYVQSDLLGAYSDIKELLGKGKKVLFVGTQCQTAAIKAHFKTAEGLFLMDFICHGIVSQLIFDEYRRYLEKKYHSTIIKFEFRNKKNGWLLSGVRAEFKNGKVYEAPLGKDLYMQGYFQNLNVRESCSSCAYKGGNSESDITIGDFWGVENLYPRFYEYYGNSVVICNTDEGVSLFESIKPDIETIDISMDDILLYNKGIAEPFAASSEREEYFRNAKNRGYIKPLEKYLYGTGIRRIKNEVKNMIKRLIGR